MKIAHLFQEAGIRFWEPHAAQLHIYHTIRGLQQAGHEVALLALQRRRVLFSGELAVFGEERLPDSYFGRLGPSGSAPFRWFESGVRRLQTELNLPYLALFDSYRMADACNKNLRGYDLIHERFNLLALGGALASRRLGIPFVLEVNADLLQQRAFKGVPERGVRGRFAKWATQFTFETATKIICISEELQAHLARQYHLDESKLAVLPCAADVQRFAPNGNAAAVRERLGLTESERVIIWIGGFYPWHDLDLLLDSFAEVLHHCPQARLVLVGDGQTYGAVAQKVAQNGLRHAVIMTGAVEHATVPEMLSVADVAVVPSAPVPAHEGGTGTPLKLFEYMAAGKAIVATALNHATGVIEQGYNGLLVAPGDRDGFAQAMLSLLGDDRERERLGDNARRQALERHSWEQYTRELEAIYLDIVQ